MKTIKGLMSIMVIMVMVEAVIANDGKEPIRLIRDGNILLPGSPEETTTKLFTAELFPMSDITVGITVKELEDRYATLWKPIRSIAQCVSHVIRGNMFWTKIDVGFANAKVKSVHYDGLFKASRLSDRNIHDNNDMEKHIKSLLEQLKQQMGAVYEKNVSKYPVVSWGKVQCPMYIWKRENDVVIFTHEPIEQWEKMDSKCPYYSIVFLSNDVPLEERFRNATAEDATLWLDAR